MSDTEAINEKYKPFDAERAKTGRAKCKKCKCAIDKDTLRVAKIMTNPYGEGIMKAWHHLPCLFEVFCKQRATTKKIDNPIEDISGWETLCDEDKDLILEKLKDFEAAEPFKGAKPNKIQIKTSQKVNTSPEKKTNTDSSKDWKTSSPSQNKPSNLNKTPAKDHLFFEFQRICNELAKHPSYLEKTAIVKKLFTKGSDNESFKGDIILWCRLLLPGVVKQIYNLQSKTLVKLFSRILRQDESEMLVDLEKGDIAETIRSFYESSLVIKPASESTLSLQEIDLFLERLAKLTKEDEQMFHFKSIIGRCTLDDLKMIIRLIKHDLRINAGPKHILGGVHSEAYEAFQLSRDLPAVINRCLGTQDAEPSTSISPVKNNKVALSMMTPVLPMLAEPCKSVEMAMEKCPNGMLSEIKYDGERVQVHKKGSEFAYFSRSLKAVTDHKVSFIKEFIPKAIPKGDDLILDAEILMIDTKTGQPLPFGSLGKHKQSEFKDANVCLFIFDILYYNGKVLLDHTMQERRKILEKHVNPIENRIMLSETKVINQDDKLRKMIAKVFKLGLEGLVLKDVDSKYEPGKRHWLKVKKDYLFRGAIADSADLVVLGAWYGTGQKGGMMSIFLMGCYDPSRKKWLTVTKVHGGHDDATLAELQTTLDMVKISKDPTAVPSWLIVNKPMVPDFIAKDPKRQPVWEITGAEFTNQGCHTADSISIRFPRVTRIRGDKNWETATNIDELRNLFNRSSESIDYESLLGARGKEDDESTNLKCKKLKSPRKGEKRAKKESSSDTSDHGNLELDSEKVKDAVSPKIKKLKINENSQTATMSGSGEDKTKASPSKKHKKKVKTQESNNNSDSETLKVVEKDKKKNIFSDVNICFAKDYDQEKKKRLKKLMQNFGAMVDNETSFVDFVIHKTNTITITELRAMNVSKSARHVNENWVTESIAREKLQNIDDYAVTVTGVYCNCSCPH